MRIQVIFVHVLWNFELPLFRLWAFASADCQACFLARTHARPTRTTFGGAGPWRGSGTGAASSTGLVSPSLIGTPVSSADVHTHT